MLPAPPGQAAPLAHFSLEEDAVALPRGAWARARRLNVRWRGRTLFALSQGEYRAYLYPVFTPTGVAVTAESPIDHPHHHSVWIGADHVTCRLPYATGRLEAATYNFYVNETFQGRAPGRIVGISVRSCELAADHLRVVQTLEWQGPVEWGAPERRTIALETRTIDVRPGAEANLVHLRSELRPTEWSLTIGPTRHAYFGVRVADGLRVVDGGVLTGPDGPITAAAIPGRSLRWLDCSGVVGGRPAGLAVFPAPSLGDLAWSAADWGMIAVNPLVDTARRLDRGDVLDLAVRLVVHDGDVREARIAELSRAFVAEGE
jgi:hypothetical protein